MIQNSTWNPHRLTFVLKWTLAKVFLQKSLWQVQLIYGFKSLTMKIFFLAVEIVTKQGIPSKNCPNAQMPKAWDSAKYEHYTIFKEDLSSVISDKANKHNISESKKSPHHVHGSLAASQEMVECIKETSANLGIFGSSNAPKNNSRKKNFGTFSQKRPRTTLTF